MKKHRRLRTKLQAFVLCLTGLCALAVPSLDAQSHHFVYLSSASARTVSGFESDPVSGSLTQVSGSPFNEGHDPGGLVFHPSGRFLYAVNAGDRSVSAFAVNHVTGVLAELPASPFAVGSGDTPAFVAVEPSGKFLYVVGTSPGPPSTVTSVSYYSIDSTGALSATADNTISLGLFSPVGLVSKPGGQFMYLVETSGSNSVSIFALELDAVTGALNNILPFTGTGQFARSVALAPQGQFLFVSRGQTQGFIDTYALPSDGNFSSPVTSLSIPNSSGLPLVLATDVSGSYLYAGIANAGIAGFSVNSTTGLLTPLTGSPFVGPPVSASSVLGADPVAQFPYLYYGQRPFGISGSGALNELATLAASGTVTGIAAASPLDQVPTDPVNPISGPAISLSPVSLQFSGQFVGNASPSRSITITNAGGEPLILSEIKVTGANAADYVLSPNCTSVVNAGEGCTIAITFQPSAPGQREAVVRVTDNAPDSPHTVSLAGVAQLPFAAQLDNSTSKSTIAAGQTAQYNLLLVPATGFTGRVSLTCSGAPDQATCSAPSFVDLNGPSAVAFSVMVPTKARSTFAAPTRRRLYPGFGDGTALRILVWGTLLAMLFVPVSLRSRWRIHSAAILLAIIASLTLMSCSRATGVESSSTTSTGPAGGSSTSSSTTPAPSSAAGTPAGQYTLTLTATWGTVTQTVPLSLSVQ